MNKNADVARRLLKIARNLVAYEKVNGAEEIFGEVYTALDNLAACISENGEKNSIKLFVQNLFRKNKKFKVDDVNALKERLEDELIGTWLEEAAKKAVLLKSAVDEKVSRLNAEIDGVKKGDGPGKYYKYEIAINPENDDEDRFIYNYNALAEDISTHVNPMVENDRKEMAESIKSIVEILEKCKSSNINGLPADAAGILGGSLDAFDKAVGAVVLKIKSMNAPYEEVVAGRLQEVIGKIDDLKDRMRKRMEMIPDDEKQKKVEYIVNIMDDYLAKVIGKFDELHPVDIGQKDMDQNQEDMDQNNVNQTEKEFAASERKNMLTEFKDDITAHIHSTRDKLKSAYEKNDMQAFINLVNNDITIPGSIIDDFMENVNKYRYDRDVFRQNEFDVEKYSRFTEKQYMNFEPLDGTDANGIAETIKSKLEKFCIKPIAIMKNRRFNRQSSAMNSDGGSAGVRIACELLEIARRLMR